jgi:DNA-directed RNA polymerase subunit M/transcription elongation factor TFIIS
MNFCNQCGSILTEKRGGEFLCSCGNAQTPRQRTVQEKVDQVKALEIMERNNPLASYEHVCSKCGFDKAQVVTKGIMITDEDEYVAFVCGSCGHHDKPDGMKVT